MGRNGSERGPECSKGKGAKRYFEKDEKTPEGEPKNKRKKVDEETIRRRQKQIDYGKNNTSYDYYKKKVPKNKRPRYYPRTPDITLEYSRRQWDGLIKSWKLRVHDWVKKDKAKEDEKLEKDSNNEGKI